MKRFGVLLVAIALVLFAWSPAFAIPPIPHHFSGRITVDGDDVQDGTIIAAWTGTTQLVTATTLIDPPGSGNSYYVVTVPGDDSETPGIIEGAYPGAVIRFYIGSPYMTWAEQQATWQSGEITTLNLTATTDSPVHRLYCPIISRP
jgi:hypothetical protein